MSAATTRTRTISTTLSDLLKEQYVLVERFANTQTMLFNAVITTESKSSSSSSALSSSQPSYHSSYSNDGGGGASSASPTITAATKVADHHDLQLCRAVNQLEQTKKDLRRNWKQLVELIDTTTTSDGPIATITTSSSKLPLSSLHERNVYTEHLKISQRVIRTLQQSPQWHSNGLPMINISSSSPLHSSSSLQTIETTTIALATLKASIANVLLSSSSSS